MLTSGLTNAPISKALLIYTVAASVALAIFDIKHLALLQITPHLWPYGQYWRLAAWQVAGFGNSTEALFAAMLAYHLRVVERAWGTRKMGTFLLTTLPYTTLLPPLLLLLLRPLTLTKLNALPSGPTATLFALLAQYHAAIPPTVRYCLSTASNNPSTPTSATQHTPPPTDSHSPKSNLTLTLSDKSTTYLVAAQLAASQFPTMLLPAVVGWGVGLAWRTEALPLSFVPGGYRWRVPGWVVGQADRNRAGVRGRGGEEVTGSGGERYEELRRRLEGEVVAASGSEGAGAGAGAGAGIEGAGAGAAQRLRRGVGA